MSYALLRESPDLAVKPHSSIKPKNSDHTVELLTVPASIQSEIARRVDNRSFNLLAQISEQTTMSLFIETNLYKDGVSLDSLNTNEPLWDGQIASSWIVTFNGICGDNHCLQLFDTQGSRLCSLWSDFENQACWHELLEALPISKNT